MNCLLSVQFFLPEDQTAAQQGDGEGNIQPGDKKHKEINALGIHIQKDTRADHHHQGQKEPGVEKIPQPGGLQTANALDVPPTAARKDRSGLNDAQDNPQANEKPVPTACGAQLSGLK